jgi:hypothetical protein
MWPMEMQYQIYLKTQGCNADVQKTVRVMGPVQAMDEGMKISDQ